MSSKLIPLSPELIFRPPMSMAMFFWLPSALPEINLTKKLSIITLSLLCLRERLSAAIKVLMKNPSRLKAAPIIDKKSFADEGE